MFIITIIIVIIKLLFLFLLYHYYYNGHENDRHHHKGWSQQNHYDLKGYKIPKLTTPSSRKINLTSGVEK